MSEDRLQKLRQKLGVSSADNNAQKPPTEKRPPTDSRLPAPRRSTPAKPEDASSPFSERPDDGWSVDGGPENTTELSAVDIEEYHVEDTPIRPESEAQKELIIASSKAPPTLTPISPPAPPVAAADENDDELIDPTINETNELTLDDDDLLEVNTAPGLERQKTSQPPANHDSQPKPAASSPPIETLDEQSWEEGRRFYLGEATACAEHQPERAALMWIEAARLAEHGGVKTEKVISHLEAALELCWDSSQLLPAIRRTLLRYGQYDRALQLARRELQLGGSNSQRSAVLFETAGLVRFRNNDAVEALALLDQAATIQPGSVAALSFISGLLLDSGQHTRRAEVLQQLIESLSSPQEKALQLYALGTTYEYKIGQRDAAEAAYSRAFEADPENLPAIIALCNSYERGADSYEELCRRLEQWSQLVSAEGNTARLLMRAGLVGFEKLADLESAARCFLGAARAAPLDRSARRRLAEVYTATDRPEELVTTLRQMLDQTLDGQGRAALQCRIGWLLANRLNSVDEAVGAYRAALDALPGYLPALQALGTIFRKRGDFANLVAVNVAETETAADTLPMARAARYLDTAEILAHKLDRVDEAIEACHHALDLVPGMPLAYWQLAELLERNGKYIELSELMAKQAETTGDPKTKHLLLMELARLQAGPLDAIDEAIETLKSALPIEQTRAAAIELSRLYQRAGRAAEQVELLLTQATDAEDRAEAQALLLRAAQLLDRELEEPDRALDVYRSILEEDPGSLAALRSAALIVHRLGRWLELIDLHRRELDQPGSDKAVMYCRIGRIYDEELGKHAEAIDAYRHALSVDGGCATAVSALERLLRASGRWQQLVMVLQRYAEVRTEPVAKADAFCRCAEIAELHLDDLQEAASLYQKAIAAADGFFPAVCGLYYVRLRQGDWQGLTEVLDQLEASAAAEETKAQARLMRLRVAEYRHGEQLSATSYLELVSKLPAGDRLFEEVTRLYHDDGLEALGSWLAQRGTQSPDPQLAVAYLLQSSLMKEFSSEPEDCLELCRRAYERRSDDPAVLWALERAVWRAGDLAEMARLYEREAKLEFDGSQKSLRLSAAAAAFLKAGQVEDATRVAKACLASDSRNVSALRLLRQLAELRQDWSSVAELSDQLAAACINRDNRLEASRRAAEVWANDLNDPSRAISSLKFALATDPTDDEAFSVAETILRDRGEFAELSLLFEQRIKATETLVQKLDLLRRHASLLQENMAQPNRAIGELKELLDLRPNDEAALRQLADLYSSKEHWSDAASTLGVLIERTEDAQQRHDAQLRQADLYLHKLHEPRRAYDVLALVLEREPGDVAAKRLLVELAIKDGDWPEAKRILEELATDGDAQLKVWALTRLADVANIGLRDQELRNDYETAALTEAATERALLEQVVEGYWERRQQRRLLHLGEEIIRSTTRADVIVPLRVLVARLLLEEGSDAALALELLRESMVAAPKDEEVQLLFAQALEAAGDDSSAVAAYRRILNNTVDCVPAHQGLARLFGRQQQPELAAASSSVLELFGAADADQSVQARTLEDGIGPAGRLDLSSRPLPPELRAVASLLEPSLPYLGELYPAGPQQGWVQPSHPAAVACQRLARSIGIAAVKVAIGGTDSVVSGYGSPALVGLSPQLAEAPQSARFRLWVGRALCEVATAAQLLSRLSDTELTLLVTALCTPRPMDQATQQLRKQLNRSLPRKLRKQLELATPPRPTAQTWARYRETESRRIDELGLLICRSPRVTISELARVEQLGGRLNDISRLAHLVRFASSDAFATEVRRLWNNPAQ